MSPERHQLAVAVGHLDPDGRLARGSAPGSARPARPWRRRCPWTGRSPGPPSPRPRAPARSGSPTDPRFAPPVGSPPRGRPGPPPGPPGGVHGPFVHRLGFGPLQRCGRRQAPVAHAGPSLISSDPPGRVAVWGSSRPPPARARPRRARAPPSDSSSSSSSSFDQVGDGRHRGAVAAGPTRRRRGRWACLRPGRSTSSSRRRPSPGHRRRPPDGSDDAAGGDLTDTPVNRTMATTARATSTTVAPNPPRPDRSGLPCQGADPAAGRGEQIGRCPEGGRPAGQRGQPGHGQSDQGGADDEPGPVRGRSGPRLTAPGGRSGAEARRPRPPAGPGTVPIRAGRPRRPGRRDRPVRGSRP